MALTGQQEFGLGLGGAALAIPALFGGGDDGIGDAIKGLQSSADKTGKLATSLTAQGESTLGPVLEYLRNLTSPNRGDLLAATAPQRKRVIDQYDAAKRSAAEFSPRGGGTAGSLNAIGAAEASDLATVGADARGKAFTDAGDIGGKLLSAGTSAESSHASDLNAIISALQTKAAAKGQSMAGIGAGVAQLIGLAFL